MHTALVLGALLATLDPPGLAPAGPAALDLADPCDAVEALPAPPACAGVPLCGAGERVRTACELRAAMQARYVFLESKGMLLGAIFNGRARLDACAAAERAIDREDEPLRFLDRIRRCVAGFEDGHLLVSTPARLPQVALGIGLRAVGGTVVVAWREPAFRRLVGDGVAAALPIGSEIVAVDGRPVAEAAADLAREIPASSAAARLVRAVEALARRDFAFPERRTAELTVSAAGVRRTVELPWWVSPGAERHPLAAGWARRTGIGTTDLLAWFEDAIRPRPGAVVDGAPGWAPIVAPPAAAGLREYTDENGRVAVRLGAVARGAARDLCYLQILSFHTQTLTGPGGRRPFANVVDELARDCGKRRLDLVLDLRRNEGGYLDHSTAVAEALAPTGATQPGAALLLRATERNEAVYRERAAQASNSEGAASAVPTSGGAPAMADVLAPAHILAAIGVARGEGRPLTPAFVAGPLRPRPAVGGYGGRVVALTTPACMSACDRLAALLRASGRAVLIGGPTEGAGGSQQETPGLPAKWTDSQRFLSVSIPNAAFGVPRAAARAASGDIPFEAFFEEYGIENRPVEPDVRYEPRLEDVTASGRGWLEQVDAVLFEDLRVQAQASGLRRQASGQTHVARDASPGA